MRLRDFLHPIRWWRGRHLRKFAEFGRATGPQGMRSPRDFVEDAYRRVELWNRLKR